MDWTRGPVLGRGSSATVSLATTFSGELFAVKSTDLSSSGLLQKERSLISKLNSPYVIKYLGFDVTHENNKPMFNLFVEYAEKGTLFDEIKKQGGSLKESWIQFYAYQILKGLDYLHSNEIVHCDIKPQNVLIWEDGVKIADFGCAKSIEDMTTFSGTPIFMAPEVARGEKQGFESDIWALGCTIIEMATGSNPWPECKESVSALYTIGHSEEEVELPGWLSGEAEDFLRKCLMRNPNERWTAKQLLGHKFLENLKGNSKMETFLEKKSPTSILDQDIWDSFEVSATSMEENRVLSIYSPADRLRKLISDFGSALNLPNWVDEEGWITVRGSDEEGVSNLCEGNLDIKQYCQDLVEAEDLRLGAIDVEEEPLSSISFQDFLFNYYDGEIRNVIMVDGDTDLLMYIESLNHVLVTIIIELESNTFEIPFQFVKNYLLLFHFMTLFLFVITLDQQSSTVRLIRAMFLHNGGSRNIY